jgi:hypothetical protein
MSSRPDLDPPYSPPREPSAQEEESPQEENITTTMKTTRATATMRDNMSRKLEAEDEFDQDEPKGSLVVPRQTAPSGPQTPARHNSISNSGVAAAALRPWRLSPSQSMALMSPPEDGKLKPWLNRFESWKNDRETALYLQQSKYSREETPGGSFKPIEFAPQMKDKFVEEMKPEEKNALIDSLEDDDMVVAPGGYISDALDKENPRSARVAAGHDKPPKWLKDGGRNEMSLPPELTNSFSNGDISVAGHPLVQERADFRDYRGNPLIMKLGCFIDVVPRDEFENSREEERHTRDGDAGDRGHKRRRTETYDGRRVRRSVHLPTSRRSSKRGRDY